MEHMEEEMDREKRKENAGGGCGRKEVTEEEKD